MQHDKKKGRKQISYKNEFQSKNFHYFLGHNHTKYHYPHYDKIPDIPKIPRLDIVRFDELHDNEDTDKTEDKNELKVKSV